MNIQKNKYNLRKIVLGSILISLALVLSQINNLFIKNISFIKMPLSQVPFWAFWYLPIIIICVFFSFNYSLFFVSIYIIIFSYFYSLPNYIKVISLFKDKKMNIETRFYFIFIMELFGTFFPLFSYLFLSLFKFSFFQKKFKKILFCFILIILIQSISRTRVGWIWINFYGSKLQTNSNIIKFLFVFIFNIIPVFISNLINFILLFFIKSRIVEIYNFNYSEK
ncbi:MAG: hypothetical protein Q8781_00675 [Candidatus Phytoplasma stylosanthis]|uniref:hypothetical protein n=1 Tax=Candidatus Phytoplasma stylosanthis TaxID=2798314 RepID=UPI00293A97EE|nr:hypothetical protein [Candidatus Phytoplasma stylosanthis]MDV3168039.1 hypothetical protein [Candidatus Phytoplasma stylosanthis]MDV3170803.1 hypothetical protein [Candidatus Phytoplasma stylosanthis]MDV3173601.1 hypothetical protein [Candidatus Phytoplasma stylosanthis]MDV3174183.1 hypothetical protein [Candidatus Phytoplasma stylosanthis]MDV3202526.1 hypothetical protein [Candidatus Phytoplasma stylosanthis]